MCDALRKERDRGLNILVQRAWSTLTGGCEYRYEPDKDKLT